MVASHASARLTSSTSSHALSMRQQISLALPRSAISPAPTAAIDWSSKDIPSATRPAPT